MKNFRFGPYPPGPGSLKILLMMKLTICLLTISVVSMAADAYSQTARVNLKVNGSTLIEIFRQIEETSQVGFFFKNDQLDLTKKYTVSFENSPVEEVLDILLGEGYSYRYIGNNVVITADDTSFRHPSASQQNRGIKGKVTNTQSEPIPGASVMIKGTANGTVTDAEGNYSLTDVPPDGVLVFSFVGMRSREVLVDGRSEIVISLEDETIGLDEVVAVGYGIQKKVNLTGAITAVEPMN